MEWSIMDPLSPRQAAGSAAPLAYCNRYMSSPPGAPFPRAYREFRSPSQPFTGMAVIGFDFQPDRSEAEQLAPASVPMPYPPASRVAMMHHCDAPGLLPHGIGGSHCSPPEMVVP